MKTVDDSSVMSRCNRRIIEITLTALVVFCTTLTGILTHDFLCFEDKATLQPGTLLNRPTEGFRRRTTFLLGIFCTIEDVKARKRTRQTMLGADLPTEVQSRLCSLSVYLAKARPNCQIIYAFVVGANPNAAMEYEEGTQLLVDPPVLADEEDVVHLNIRENMNRGKTPSWFDYASKALLAKGVDYVAKLDLDTLVSIPQLLDFVDNELPPHTAHPPRVYGGILMDFEACGGKFWPMKCDPVKGKSYMSGQFYFLSYDVVQFVGAWRTNRTFKERKIEDLSMGIRVWAYPFPIKLVAMNPSFFWVHGLKNDTLWYDCYDNTVKGKWNISSSHFVNSIYKPKEYQ